MGTFGKQELKLRLGCANQGCDDMAKEGDIPANIHVKLALLALESAIAGIRLMKENDISTCDCRDSLPVILGDLNKATFFLSKLNTPSKPMPIHGFN
jgi:hypothetical protein